MKPVVQKSSLNLFTHTKKILMSYKQRILSAFCIIAQNVPEEPYQHLGVVVINTSLKGCYVAIQVVSEIETKKLSKVFIFKE